MKLFSKIDDKNCVTFYVLHDGEETIILQANLKSKSDMVRLYAIAKDRLNEINCLVNQQAA